MLSVILEKDHSFRLRRRTRPVSIMELQRPGTEKRINDSKFETRRNYEKAPIAKAHDLRLTYWNDLGLNTGCDQDLRLTDA